MLNQASCDWIEPAFALDFHRDLLVYNCNSHSKEMSGHLYKLIASFIVALVQREQQSFCENKKTSALFIVFDVSSMIGFTSDRVIREMNDGLELVILVRVISAHA